MSEKPIDAKASKETKKLKNADNWKHLARWNGEGYYELRTEDTGDVPVRLFFTPGLFKETENLLYRQIVNATRFPGVKLVAITPDAHYGYGVPVGCVMLTDAESGAVAMGPVGYDISCFAADTLIPTIDGNSYPIGALARLNREIFVYSISQEHKVVVARATARKTRAHAPLVRVILDNDREIVCTPDHEFMLRDGTYRQAKDMIPGTSLMPFNKHVDVGQRAYHSKASGSYNHKAVSVVPLNEVADVYCLTVPEYGNFALDAGVFVHNCGMVSAKSDVPADAATPDRRMEFNRAVMQRVSLGAGGKSVKLGKVDESEFLNLIYGGAEYYVEKYGASFDRSRAERHRMPVGDDWQIPWGGKGRPERGLSQLGSLGGGECDCLPAIAI